MKEAIESLKAGNRDRAFSLLRRHLAAHPRDANAWLWMSEALTEPVHQIDALQRVLVLDPEHPHAGAIRQRLRTLHALTQPQRAILESPSPALEKPAPDTPSPSTEESLARLRGESLGQKSVAEERPRDASPAAPRPIKAPESLSERIARGRLSERPVTDGASPEEADQATPGEHEKAPTAVETEEVGPLDTGRIPLDPALLVDEAMPAQLPPTSPPSPPMGAPDGMPVPQPVQPEPEVAPSPSPSPREEPVEQDEIPKWVWGIMLLSLILVILFLTFLFQLSTAL